MSKFFKGAVSSSDSSDSESSGDEGVPTRTTRPVVKTFDYPSDSDDEAQKRVVKAQKDRKFDELKDLIKQSKNSKNIKDMSKLMTLQEDLAKLFEKTRPVISREGLTIPRFYIRYLVELEDFVNEQWEDREGRKTMSKANSKGLTTLRQKLRKYNKDFENEISAYRGDPDPIGYSSAEEAGAENDVDELSDNDEADAIADKAKAKRPVKKPLDEESDDDWSSSGESSESELSDIEGKQMEDLRKFFLKKEFKKDDKDAAAKPRKRDKVKRDKVDKDESDDNERKWEKVLTKEDKERQLFAANAEITHEAVVKKLSEIIAARGRKSTNRKHHVRSLQELLRYSDDANLGPGLAAKILFAIISGLFELNVKINDFMEFSTWHKTLDAISGLISLLTESPNVSLTDRITEDDESLIDPKEPYRVHGSIILAVERLDTEFTKILQNADCHSTDYVEKLKGEKDLCALIEKAQTYIESHPSVYTDEDFCKIYILRIEHLYYKYESEEDRATVKEPSAAIMDRLCKAVYARDQGKRLRQRAMLCHIYHHALHDRWHQARDLMLMSHLQATVDHSDVSTQILHNRAICQLGLCAFRHGYIKEAHQGLSEIQNTQRSKELLAQGLAMRQQDRTAEQEKQERARQIPYHMHINVELMECVYLICSMLLEIPQMASREYELRRRMLSRSFHYQLKQSEKSSLIGPPENTREHVVAASRAMLAGDWVKCRDFIVNEKMNAKVWNLFRNSEQVKAMVVRRIQEESLRTYLLTYSTVYTTVSLDTLADLFELEKKAVHALISKMIIQEELLATLDAPTDCLIMHREEPSRLQLLGLQMTEKLSALADNNDQIMEPRTGRGGYTGPGNWYGRQDRGDDKQRQQRQGYQGNRQGGGYQGGRSGGGYQNSNRSGYQGGRGGGGYGGGGRSGGGGQFSNRRPWEQNQNNRGAARGEQY